MAEVTVREKDIRFSSRTRLNTSNAVALQAMAHAARRLMARLPPPFRDDPDLKLLTHARSEKSVDIVHLIYRGKHHEGQSKDYEFSRASVRDHWAAGRADMAHTLHDPRWTDRHPSTGGTRIFDLTAGRSLILRKSRSAN